MGKYTEAQNKASQKWQKDNMDRVYLKVRKGKKEAYQELCESTGESLSGIIQRLMDAEYKAVTGKDI